MSIIAQMHADRYRLLTKATQSLLGICTGLIADGQLNDAEIRFLSLWMKENDEVLLHWPGDIIAQRVTAVLQDGAITEEERKDLLETLTSLTGIHFVENGSSEPEAPATLPIDDSAPVIFVDKEFCFTGKFIYGTRNACTGTTTVLGGIVADRVGKNLDYLVIGSLTNPTWAYEAHGRKIEQAAINRAKTGKPQIVSERHWTSAIKQSAITKHQPPT